MENVSFSLFNDLYDILIVHNMIDANPLRWVFRRSAPNQSIFELSR